MKDLFSLNGKNKDHVIMHLKEGMYSLIENDNWITVTIRKWFHTMVISYLICNDLVTLTIVRTKFTPFYEKYTVL
ncbi:hypothetical protein J2795_001661 [Chryseobacterium bernardetii]|uniref:Uncharacterized protein n=2 Tax=Chryseobacterium TaxID=59732 RepID=A0A543EII4_9FLAO|nr:MULTISPECIES: hypothetical protein [Chryseobacterium]MDR6369796.1 hypothetical protein [Chryseobacterium vietnamense]MDR6440961.1 hypothetical protein [Chryseobacterium bernardetii]TQM21359.1 hypothetical protein FB551_1045 [Chryseobacterium aquifrigidense]